MLKRREILGALGTGAAGLALFARNTDAAAGQSGTDDPKHAGMKHSCCDACGECAQACNKAFHISVELASAGKPRYARMAQTVADCAAFCALSAQMISRNSVLMTLSCQACADACQRCGQECETFDTDLDMKICLDACKRCEESCRNMVKAMGHAPATAPKAN
jgi:NAD-dependent dihydropyrimidine dehydrogenase PreA subunit